METIEIKLRKKPLLAFMAVVAIITAGFAVYIFTAKAYSNNNFLKLLQALMSIYLVYNFGKLIGKLKKDEAVLTIASGSITLNRDGTAKTFGWKEIQGASVTKDDGTDYLLLQTFYGEEKIGISWLHKSPTQIQNLIEEYRSYAASREAFGKGESA